MTINNLQTAMREEVDAILSSLRLKRPDGSYATMSVFEQGLPVPQESDEADAAIVNMPYAIVRITSGKVTAWEDPHVVQAVILFCTWDNDANRQGYKDGLIIIDRIMARFQKRAAIGNFVSTGKMEWAMNEEDTHPYYLGAVQIDFEVPKMVKEDPLA